MTDHVLMLCDIVGSTAMTEQLGDVRAAAAFAEHDRVARELLAQWRGREIDKSDGLLALFETADDALGYARTYHSRLAALDVPLAARAGLHRGPLILRENPPEAVARGAKPLEVEGLAKPVVARLAALAAGGQTILSASLASSIPPSAGAPRSIGYWLLKGIESPLEAFVADDGSFQAPHESEKALRVERHGELWLPARPVAHSLLPERDEFVGRGPQLIGIRRMLASGTRLVSLAGPGGSGKTRLAQRLGWASLIEFPGGVWFCDLSSATSLLGVLHAVAQGLQVPLALGDPTQQIGHAISGRGRCLLILDNFEQVTRHAEQTVGTWLQAAPAASFIVTTREVLGIAGEHAIHLPALSAGEGSSLFMQRAAAAVHGYSPSAGEQAAIRTLIDLLDGLPLSIELAAARIGVMPPSRMVARIGERFKLLVSRGGRNERQATMRATLDWSWDLLNEAERAALVQLSFFEGGFTLEAAEAVLDLAPHGASLWVPDVVQALMEKSLVRAGRDDRLELSRTVCDYARSRLAGVSEANAVRARHWRFFARYDDPGGVDAPDEELENLVAACSSAGAGGDYPTAVSALAAAWTIIKRVGPFEVAYRMASRLGASAPQGTSVVGRALMIEAAASAAAGDSQKSIGLLRRALEGPGTDEATRATLLCSLGEMLGMTGQMTEADECLTQALGLGRRLNDDRLVRLVLNERGAWCMRQSKLQEARGCYAEAYQLARRHSDRRWEAGLLGNLGVIEHLMGDAEAARRHYTASLELLAGSTHRVWEGNTRCNLGQLHQEQGREEDARVEFERSLAIARYVGHRRLECTVSCNVGLLHERLGNHEQAVDHFRNSAVVARAMDDARAEGQSLGYLALALSRVGRHGEAAEAFDSALSRLAGVGDPMSLGLLQCTVHEAARLRGDADTMVRSALAAREYLAQIGGAAGSELAQRLAALGLPTAGDAAGETPTGPG